MSTAVQVRREPFSRDQREYGERSPPDSWSATNGTVSRDSGTVHGDSNSLKFVRDAVGSDGTAVNSSIGVSTGKLYYVEAWVYNADLTSISLEEELSSDGSYAVLDSTTVQGIWVKLSGYVTAVDDDAAADILIRFTGIDGQVGYADDVIVEEITDGWTDGVELVTGRADLPTA